MERRSHPRVPYSVLVLYRTDPNQPFVSVYARDLSEAGVSLEGVEAEAGTVLDLQLMEREGRRPLELLGMVTRAEDGVLSARFLELDDAQRAWLRAAVTAREGDTTPVETEDLLATRFDEF